MPQKGNILYKVKDVSIKKLARNLHKGMKKMNVINIETVKRYDIRRKFSPKNHQQSLSHKKGGCKMLFLPQNIHKLENFEKFISLT